ncbi:PREDICTED: pectinesterase inhibitor 2-like [Camelina sativa]|uniref:Pectinesterase inhibitor 2-like n=1 Tax=Camelina sativa TaxID=90675 RepID=A0ABM1R7B3_CAMSA|nr:PREDICTED: pectinesterase inhibitor 2-like [Camelina sativa]
MVVYIKNNFLSVSLVILFFLVASSNGRFDMKISVSEINTICSEGANPSFCFQFFKSTPETKTMDLSGVAEFLIKYASRNAIDLSNQFKSLVKSPVDPRSKSIYAECSQLYEIAVSNFDDALKDLAAKDNLSLNVNVSAAMTDGVTCKDDLVSVRPSPKLLKKISDIDNLSAIVLVISKILP